ncbi:hypothetical protein [Paratissierella segnis]|jgi:hypothetical protein|uniref:Uncharacterized protein n=1 Tax=Paratissierella segnis TaxID=2763679 RepID=A0A926EY09_9FIRM|nr:hypothetical protein [Paratissierella segnis]MBC8588310.1 hypothetical protein [Paratissierella segnis]
MITELVNDTILSSYDYIKNAIPLITKLSDEFYQLPDNNSWKQLTNLFEGIQWIIQTLTQIDSINDLNSIINYEKWNEYVQAVSQLNEFIPELENSIINKDNILIGDLLLYEIVPTFENMLDKLQLLKPKAVKEDVN